MKVITYVFCVLSSVWMTASLKAEDYHVEIGVHESLSSGKRTYSFICPFCEAIRLTKDTSSPTILWQVTVGYRALSRDYGPENAILEHMRTHKIEPKLSPVKREEFMKWFSRRHNHIHTIPIDVESLECHPDVRANLPSKISILSSV